jgi:molybdenum cofactor cytidylyltransferase
MSIVPNDDLRNGFVGVLLAGGQGTRFRADVNDPQADKLLAQLPDGRAVASVAAATLRRVVPVVIAVIRPGSAVLKNALQQEGCIVIESADAQRGMGASLAAAARYAIACVEQTMPAGKDGARACADAANMPAALLDLLLMPPRGCVVALADMPWLQPATIQAVLHASGEHRVTAGSCRGRRGHPVAFAWELMPELAALDGDTGARALLARHGVHEVECDDSGILCDVDTGADLAAGSRMPDANARD